MVAAPAISPDQLVGKWGLASYHRDSDRDRTVKEAKAQCNKPYVIDKGPNGGVMMYLADQKEKSELVLKAGKDGVTYLGPPGDAGTADDRMISNIDAELVHHDLGGPGQRRALWHHGLRALRQAGVTRLQFHRLPTERA